MFGFKKKHEVVGYSKKTEKRSFRLTEDQVKDINRRIQEAWDKMEGEDKGVKHIFVKDLNYEDFQKKMIDGEKFVLE